MSVCVFSFRDTCLLRACKTQLHLLARKIFNYFEEVVINVSLKLGGFLRKTITIQLK